MYIKKWRRYLSGFMAAALLLSNVGVYATDFEESVIPEIPVIEETIPEENYSEPIAVEPIPSEEPVQDEAVEELPDEADIEENASEPEEDTALPEDDVDEVIDPFDITSYKDIVALSLDNWHDYDEASSFAVDTQYNSVSQIYTHKLDVRGHQTIAFDLCISYQDISEESYAKDECYAEIVFPSSFKNLREISSASIDPTYVTYTTETRYDGSVLLRLTFHDLPGAYITQRIHFAISNEDDIESDASMGIQDHSYQLKMGPEESIVEEKVDGNTLASPESEGEAFTATDTNRISGTINFNETLGTTDWADILRPREFGINQDEAISLDLTYTKDGTEYTKTVYVQDSNSKDPYYIEFTHDSLGAGDFVIDNVPNYVEVDGEKYPIQTYHVGVAFSQNLPYYACNGIDITSFNTPANLSVGLNSTQITLQPEVLGDTEAASFNYDLKLHSTYAETHASEHTLTASSSSGNPTVLQVPYGITFDLAQKTTSGYKFTGDYYVFETGGSVPETPVSTVSNVSTNANVTVKTTNYMQNRQVPFQVKWIDNHSSTRPTLSENDFELQYMLEDGTWAEVTTELAENMSFDQSSAALGKYAYTGLPGADSNGRPLQYQVVVKNIPDHYIVDTDQSTEATTVFTFTEVKDFHARIEWLDNNDYASSRPEIDDILSTVIIKRSSNGTSEDVTERYAKNISITQNPDDPNLWNVVIHDLPSYASDNYENDYVVTIGKVDGYKKSYYNGSGSYGNDISGCHPDGTIRMLISEKTTFQATKVWKDGNLAASERPVTTVTLWRYAVGSGASASDPTDLDDVYASGQAARVVCHVKQVGENDEASYVDVLLAYDLSNATTETIVFDSSHVSGLPSSYQLPKYDEQGRLYIYFVRETVEGETYETTYDTYENGATNNGTVTNVRREKAAISVDKVWKCPSNLVDLNGASVEMRILASDPETGTKKELTVYSSETGSYQVLNGDSKSAACTVGEFSENISTLNLTFYVNICNENGIYYKMENASIEEIKVIKNGVTYTVSNDLFELIYDDQDNTYKVSSSFVEEGSYETMRQFSYQLTNTITGVRSYELIKKWDNSIPKEEYDSVKYVCFNLRRRSSRNDSAYEWVKDENGNNIVYYVSHEDDNEWSDIYNNLPKYDEDGYAYQYVGNEIGFVFNDDTYKTTKQMAEEKRWGSYTYHNDDRTTVINGIYGDDEYLGITKDWEDNGDLTNRKNVGIRIYNKEALLSALQSTTQDPISLDSLTQVSFFATTLTYSNGYFTTVSVNRLNEQLGGNKGADYLVLEYSIGSGAGGSYSRQALIAAAQNTSTTGTTVVTGDVKNAERAYHATCVTSKNSTTITNVRYGYASITIEKEWKDENNKKDTRPETVTFQIYRDGEVYQPTEDELAKLIVSGDSDSTVTLDQNGKITVQYSDPSKNTEDWTIKITKLPLFSDLGIPYSYFVSENVQEESKYFSEAGDITISDQRTETDDCEVLHYTFDFTNTLTGTTRHVGYKYWNDLATEGESRPDLYMTLYRYIVSELPENFDLANDALTSIFTEVTGYKDQKWITSELEPEDEKYAAETKYDWKFTVYDLPAYDEDGREYGYVFREEMNNAGHTVDGVYVQTVEECVDATSGDAYERFTNTITDRMQMNGVKVWKGMEGYELDVDDYPKVTIKLYRSLVDVRTLDEDILNDEVTSAQSLQNMSQEQINKLISAGYLEYIDQTELDPSVSNTYKIPEDVTLPKFNEQGKRYIYYIREEVQGEIADSLYEKVSESGNLENIFLTNKNRRQISVAKNWAGRENLPENEREKYPSLTFYLYRYEIEQGASSAILVKTEHVSAANVAAAAKTEDGIVCTFTDLLIYSPSGKEYRYYVTEKKINGYSVAYEDEAGIDTAENVETSSDRADVYSVPKLTDPNNSITVVKTTNTYNDRVYLQLDGKKIWNDYSDNDQIYGKRPEKLDLELYRYSNNEPGQQNKIESEQITLQELSAQDPSVKTPYIVWNQETEKNSWSYTIYNLEKYAPNGMSFIYVVKEATVPQGYTPDHVTEEKNADQERNGVLTMGNITNSFDLSYLVRKNWYDGNNKYNLRPETVTIILQRSIDSNNWNSIAWEDGVGTYDAATGKWTGLPYVEASEGKVVGIELSAKYVKENTAGNTWEYTFTNLPTTDGNGNEYVYRCIEYKIGTAVVTEKDGEYSSGAYVCSYKFSQAQNGTNASTIVSNKQISTELAVQKIWKLDTEDLYQSRPDKLSFVLQIRGVKENTLGTTDSAITEWHDVKLADGSSYTFDITENDTAIIDGQETTWAVILKDLPVAMIGSDGLSYYKLEYRAIEILDNDRPSGALNYKDITTTYDHRQDGDHYDTKVTNELIRKEKEITVTKTWYHQDSTKQVNAIFELLYHVEGEAADSWHCYGNVSSDKPADHSSAKGCIMQTITSGSGTDTFKWSNLPACTRDGKTITYKVIEYDIDGYATELSVSEDGYSYQFTNIEEQEYTVTKQWKNTSYAEKLSGKYTATFQLQKHIAGEAEGVWTNVGNPVELSTASVNASLSKTWKELPKYTNSGAEITYRAIETKINGVAVSNDTNGAYIVTYYFDGEAQPAFAGTKTVATNRMVYGYVNLDKTAAYLDPDITVPSITETATHLSDKYPHLENVVFDIYKLSGNNQWTLYASDIMTDADGHLKRNTDGTYGTEKRFLITGTYKLKEKSTNAGYSVWSVGQEFKVGLDASIATGEHGTAWITASQDATTKNLVLSTTYLSSGASEHDYQDACIPATSNGAAYNIESRGIITFTKTGKNGSALNVHKNATGESKPYFGVYTDSACTNQVAGMMAASNDLDQFVLTTTVYTVTTKSYSDQEALLLAKTNENGIPYLRKDSTGLLTLLSGTYYIKELVAPPGYILDTTVRKATIDVIQTPEEITGEYANNVAKIESLTDNKWPNTENVLKLYKMDQFGRKVTLKENGYLILKAPSGTTFVTGTDEIYLYQNSIAPAKGSNGTAVSEVTYNSNNNCWTITGLLDAGKVYELSEPETSVPDDNVIATTVTFIVGNDGKLNTVTGATQSDKPLVADGDDFDNYYLASAIANAIVLRDMARYLMDIEVDKVNKNTSEAIPDISFALYQYDAIDADGKPTNAKSVLESGVYLTTDSDGKIVISKQPTGVKNQITGCDLRYGLDDGNYYLVEVERGASDKYELLEEYVFFTVTPKEPTEAQTSTQDYAKLSITTTSNVAFDGNLTGTVSNTPIKKPFTVKKVGEQNSVLLAGAEFKLTYKSINDGDDGANVEYTLNCISDSNGILYIKDSSPLEEPNFSDKGHYELTETKAPDGYECTAVVTFDVDTDGAVKNLSANGATATLNEEKNTMLISNELIRLSVKKIDFDDTNTTLNGVTFTLAPKENSSFADGSTAAKTFVSGSDGMINITEGLVKHDNTYILTEVDHGDNSSYCMPEAETDRQVVFSVEKNGTITFVSGNSDLFAISGTDATLMIAKNKQISIAISKYDALTDKLLGEVTLKLTRVQGDHNWSHQWTSSSSAAEVIQDEKLTPGKYSLEEVSTVSGYNQIESILYFTIDETGNVTYAGIDDGQEQAVTETWQDSECINYTIENPTNPGCPGAIQLSVYNAPFTDLQILKKGTNGEKISGVQFTLQEKEAENAETYTATTNSDGIATFEKIPNGTYILTETKTAGGYNLLSGTIEVAIDRNNEKYAVIYLDASETQEITRTADSNVVQLTVINKKGFVLPKTGTTTPQLPKATLLLLALLEGLLLYRYYILGKRRKRGGDIT